MNRLAALATVLLSASCLTPLRVPREPLKGEPTFKVVTWNVNSLKVRMPRVEAWLSEVKPDVLAMQETKLSDDAFPALTFQSLGYDCVHHGQGQWNGVAILSRVGISEDVRAKLFRLSYQERPAIDALISAFKEARSITEGKKS